MERADLLKDNGKIFVDTGKAINDNAKRDAKIIVVGNPANTNALVCMRNAPTIPRVNFSALTRLDHNRAVGQVALKLNVSVRAVRRLTIWGNHSSTQYPDLSSAQLATDGGGGVPLLPVINDEPWVQNAFISTVQKRGAAVIAARKLSSAASAAKAITDHMRDWVLGTAEGDWVSMAVPSDGSYGIEEGVIYSFPVTCRDGTFQIIQGLPINAFSRKMMDATNAELKQERDDALTFLG